MNRKRDKDEALKRQTEWVAPRRGRKTTCSNCGILGHNARDCHKNSEEGTSNNGQVKSKKKKMDKQCDKEKKQTNERYKTQPTQDCTSDEDEGFDLDINMRSNKEKKQEKERHRTLIDEEDVEDFPLIAPQPTQDEDEDFDLDVEDDMP
ncbi:hypothetical protein H5410_059769 [Solanum commersonii]|uniref:CCHC-type domain-containing protein n=1 Tax=Solanum commersonii TaxID=4109 RepID=A0A9J5W395_SOLCO|nr:hypothetical protein H5410_059769 [Solanum commersonii]